MKNPTNKLGQNPILTKNTETAYSKGSLQLNSGLLNEVKSLIQNCTLHTQKKLR